jgi:hypothetical protein
MSIRLRLECPNPDTYPEFREIGKRMLTEWEKGALDITPTVR